VGRNRKRTIAAVAAAAVLAAVLTAVLWPSPDHKPAAKSPVVASLPLATSTVDASPVAARPQPSIPHVASAVPTQFRMSGAAFTVDASVCQMPYVRPLDPPGDQMHTVCWVNKDFGFAPASPSRGTSYILGHAWAQATLVLNPLSEFATAHVSTRARMENGIATYPVAALKGYHIRVDTAKGRLTYRVTRAYLVAKNQAGFVTSLMAEHTRNRVVVITCAVKNGVDLDQNVIVYATLIAAHAQATR
jgi:hypothetical protein